MFTLEQKMFIVECYFRNGERLENGECSYSTPRVFEEFQQNFPDFQGTYQQLAQKAYKCVNMFLETGSVLRKKGSGRQKEELEILKRLNKEFQRLTQETNLSFSRVQLILKKDLHFFPMVCLFCMKLPLDNKNPHNITSLNIDRWIDL
jgi:hypothetical protein